MALPKPQLNGDVLAYDELQTAEINKVADYVTSIEKINQTGRQLVIKRYKSGEINYKGFVTIETGPDGTGVIISGVPVNVLSTGTSSVRYVQGTSLLSNGRFNCSVARQIEEGRFLVNIVDVISNAPLSNKTVEVDIDITNYI